MNSRNGFNKSVHKHLRPAWPAASYLPIVVPVVVSVSVVVIITPIEPVVVPPVSVIEVAVALQDAETHLAGYSPYSIPVSVFKTPIFQRGQSGALLKRNPQSHSN